MITMKISIFRRVLQIMPTDTLVSLIILAYVSFFVLKKLSYLAALVIPVIAFLFLLFFIVIDFLQEKSFGTLLVALLSALTVFLPMMLMTFLHYK